jgi:5-hydroxyisourate hydrolase-like protein (transthyretin family)
MRHFISIITLLLIISTTSVMAQKNYAAEWQKVDTLEAKGLPQSALKIVNSIYARAVKDKKEAEQLKALIYQLKYREATGDSATLLNLQEVDKQITAAKGPTKAVLQSIKAEMLQRYLNNHRYQLYSRTTVADDVSTDITTWTLARLQQEISAAYEASIANARELQSVPVEQYSPILVAGKNTRQLRPTLFDLLAYRALDWFKSGESNNNPANQFELADDAAFAPAAVFAKHDFKTTDSASLQYKALLLLQELLRFHANNKAALLDADLERITYMNQIGVMPDKEELYARALQQMQQFYAGEKEVSRVIYLLAQVYWQRGNGDQDRIGLADKSENWIAQAKALCEIGIKLVPSSGAAQCQELLNGITLKRLDLSSEQVNLPGMPFRTLVTYKNINKVYLRVIRMDEAFRKTLRTAQNDYRDNQKSYWKLLRDRKPETSWEQTLPDPKDYVSHGAEIKIDALPLGQYLILASVSPDFSLDNNPLAVQLVYVSELSYINKNNAYYVLHRQSGQPLEGVKLNVWTVVDDNNGSLRLLQTAVSDKQGAVNIKPVDKNVNVRLEWTNKGDVLFLDNYKYLFVNRPVKEPAPQPRTFLFTDRSIYRPGQTLYFKGIVINKQGKDDAHQVKPDYKTTVYLYDQNGTVVDSMAVQTNEFGAYNGKFILPQGRMNGQFRLEGKAENGRAYFSVEEYKRPKFFVEFEPLKGTYRVGDSVTITGKAMAYAGSTIDGAQVKYRVQRQARFPYPWLMRGGDMWGSSNREITQGVTQTNAAGNFTITFPALPDKSVKADAKPIFTYTVYADVTDLNGESQSASKYVEAGYQALQLLVALPERVQQKELDSMRVVTQNMNGIFEPATVSIQIKALQAPDRLIRARYWEEPDQFIFTKAEYVKLFPVDVYNNENLPANWEPKATIWQQDATTQADGKAAAGKQKLAAGWYELQVTTKDKFGAIVQEKKVFELVDINAKQLGYPAFEWAYSTPQSYEPGDKVKLLLGTGANNLHVMQTLQRSEALETTSFIDMPAGIRDIPYTVKESDRGGLAMNFVFVKDSRVYNVEQRIAVPWSNKELDIKIAAHRDKLLPGEKEKWSMQISGYKGTKVAAEMLAGMYDASLDAFRPHNWDISGLYPTFYGNANWGGGDNFGMVNAAVLYNRDYSNITPWPFEYDQLNWFNWDMSGGGRLMVSGGQIMIRGASTISGGKADVVNQQRAFSSLSSKQKSALYGSRAMESDMAAPPPAAATLKEESAVGAPVATPPMENITPRKNFQETAFFYPDLRTDKDGNISFEFTVPEALTRWKFMSIANTKDMAVGTAETTIVTQKPLMVQPNAPRFVREGDNMEFTAKISNLADSTLIGQARLELLDAATMQPVDGWFRNMFPVQHFTVQKGQSTAVSFPIQIPNNFQSVLLYRVVAQAGNFSDGEENAIPVLTNSMLVTETMPMAVRGDGTHSFKMEKLLHSDTSQTLQQRGITVEFTSKPVWYAVQALPYLMEYPYQCAEQVFNRFYANALAAHIVKVTPGIKAIFKKWKTTDTAALISNLAKNEELKAVLLQETPWVMAAKNETEQKQRLALLFNLQKMQSEGEAAMQQLKDKQLPSGAFPWFTGMWEDRYITQYIMAGVGRLMQLEVTTGIDEEMVNKAIAYLDAQLDKDYYNLLHQKADMKKQQISQLQIHYLYMRSFFKDKKIPVKIKPAYDYYLSQAAKYWVSQGKYEQGMIALALYRKGDYATPANIVKSLKENAIHSPEMGMYWKNNQAGYYWYQAPIETQALMIEVFNTVTKDPDAVSDLKTWLLKNKQTNNWHTTKATADACYAMLLGSSKWLDADPQVTIRLGEETISNTTQATEAGSGYFQQYFDAKEVKPAMGNVTVTMKQSEGQPAWGAVYWQYFEQLDKITAAKTPLVLEKQLFIEKNTDKGPVLTKIADGNQLKVGDKVKVQVVLRTDRTMEYVHLRDMRAACFEPTNVISQSKWQNGLSYYESTKDASTDFFFSYLPKGTYVFEYTMFVTHQGNFSNGISTAQCMYAPEFSAHSEGIRVKVVE